MNENRHICRAKREDNGEWVYGYYVRLPDAAGSVHQMYVPADNPDESNAVYYIDPKTLGECTGCLDVQGRLIFEGDIICEGNSNKPLIVTYDGQLGRFECYDEKADVTWTFVDVNPDLIEIIGNVHEEQMKL